MIDRATAVQDCAIARLAAIEPEQLDDGTVVEAHRAPGHVALDAPAIVSGVLTTSAVHAERRVRSAVRLAADGPAGTTAETGLGALHEAMWSGRLDAYRASVVTTELDEAPPEVRATVVAALESHFDTDDASHLRRRCRRVLARISPDLLRQRAVRVRTESSLRRWADEPGVDRWEGTFPSEEAALAWAAIDTLARRYVADEVCPTLERARAKALTDLVAGNATVETVLTLTVPAAALEDQRSAGDASCVAPPASRSPGDLVEVAGTGNGQPALVSRRWLDAQLADWHLAESTPCHPVTGALLDDAASGDIHTTARTEDVQAVATAPGGLATGYGVSTPPAADGYRPSRRLVRLVRDRDRRCRFPGCCVAAIFCDLDHVRPWPAGRTTALNLICLCRRHHRIKQRPGWRVTLADDGTATWTDPTGRTRTTAPVDALIVAVLSGPVAQSVTPPGVGADAGATSRPRTVVPDGPHDILEFHLEHLAAGRHHPHETWRDQRGRRRVELTPTRGHLRIDPGFHHGRRVRRPRVFHGDDPPPF